MRCLTLTVYVTIDHGVKSTIPAPTTSPYYSGGKDFNGEGDILVGNFLISLSERCFHTIFFKIAVCINF